MATPSTEPKAIQLALDIMAEGVHDHVVAASASDDIDDMLWHANKANEWMLRRLLYIDALVEWIGEMPE